MENKLQLDNLQKNKDEGFLKKIKKINFDELLFRYRWPVTFFLIGAILIGFGVFIAKDNTFQSQTTVEVLDSATEGQTIASDIVVEVSGAVETPGVFSFAIGSRVEDALIAAGGVSADADRVWMEKFLNRAAKVSDGQKIYIARVGENAENIAENNTANADVNSGGVAGVNTININMATQKDLESLWGIGPVYAQNIIEQRPYSSVEELLTRKIIKQNVYERNKDKLTVY